MASSDFALFDGLLIYSVENGYSSFVPSITTLSKLMMIVLRAIFDRGTPEIHAFPARFMRCFTQLDHAQ